MRRLLLFIVGALFVFATGYAAAGSFYWVGWPDVARRGIAVFFLTLSPLLWFLPGKRKKARRLAGLICLSVFYAAYFTKSPAPQNFVPLHARVANVELDGDSVTITNFRDAVHPVGAPAQLRWLTKRFDLENITGAQFILQPFGNSLATVHVMSSFDFANGDHLAVSFEARRTSWDKFDPLAGFFKHDQLYAVLGTERDLFWKRLAHIPPNDLFILDITQPAHEVKTYLRRLLEFSAGLHDKPQFYSTVSESCFTTLLNLSPRIQEIVPWYDLRRWVPGASVGLFQDLGLVDNGVSTADLLESRKLGPNVKPPWEFETPNDWSRHLREQIEGNS